MEALVKSDVFFFITGSAVIIISTVVLVVLYYVIRIVRDIFDITEHVKKESKSIVDDVTYVRTNVEKVAKRVKKFVNKKSSKKET